MACLKPLSTIKKASVWPIIFTAAFLILSGNITFFEKVIDVYPFSDNTAFIISLVIFFYSILVLMLVTVSVFLPTRLVASLFVLSAAAVGYYSDQLGIVIDADMVRNIVETNYSEAGELFNTGFIVRFVLLGIVPVFILWRIPYCQSSVLKEIKNKTQLAVGALVIMTLCILPLGDHYASFFREHKPLRYYTNPIFPIYSTGKYINQAIKSSEKHPFVQLATYVGRPAGGPDRKLTILVVGETARADHFSLNGYGRITNPHLSKEDRLISYSDIASCGTSTAISVPCMFAYSGRDEFDPDTAEYQENILDILNRAGVSVLWRDNNSSSKGVANNITYQDFKSPQSNADCDIECRDTGMLNGLQAYIDEQKGDVLIVLHQMGSHGPAYYKRYPVAFEEFKPACQSAELSECSIEEIVNAYDNTILYTDYFLSKVIALLKKNSPTHETAMFYISDHGESLGEAGIYLHGLPYMLAPKAQTAVPLIAWVGSSSNIDYEKTLAIKDAPSSHDALFDTLLSVFEIQTNLKHMVAHPLIYRNKHDSAT